MKRVLLFIAVVVLAASCGTSNTALTTKADQYAAMYEQMPVVLLVMPPINNTANVDAKELLYTSISRPLAEAGYYVISPLLAMDILKAESAYDSELFVNSDLNVFRKYFGCDAVIFSEINSWAKQGFTINADIRYFIKSAYTGEIIFDRSCDLVLDLSVNTGLKTIAGTLGLLVDLAASAINTATTEHIVAARKANYYIFRDIPQGKYSPNHGNDMNVIAEPANVSANVR